MRRRRFLVSLAAVLLLVIIGIVLQAGKSGGADGRLSQQLPDGTLVTIKQVTYGSKLKVPVGNFWQRVAVQFLPARLANRIGLDFVDINSNEITYIVVENFRTNGTFSAAPAMPFNFGTTVLVDDDVGNEFYLSSSSVAANSSNDVIEIFKVPLVSHRATNLTLRVIHTQFFAGASSHEARFVVPNPAARLKPRWASIHLPVTNDSKAITAVLSAIEPTSTISLGSPGGSSLALPDSRASVQLFEAGVPSTYWSVASFRAQDEQGNETGSDAHFSPLEPRKFRFELEHELPAGDDHVLTLHDIPLPDATHNAFSPIKTNFQSAAFQINHFSRGQLGFTGPPWPMNCKIRLTIAYLDADGNRITPVKDNLISPFGAEIGFGPPIPDSIKSANIIFSFARTTNRFVEIMANPEFTPTNSPASK